MSRRDFLFRRSHIAGHAARSLPMPQDGSHDKMADPLSASSAVTSSTDVKTIVPVDPFTPIDSRTTDTSTPSSSSVSSSSSTATTSSTSASISSLTLKSSSALSTPSDTPATHSATVSTSLTVASSSGINTLPVTTQVYPSVTFTPTTSSLSPTTTSPVGSSGGTKTSTIVGGVAGTLAGIAALGFLLMWCMRRQRSRDIDDFDAQAFKRQSAILVDDPPEPPRSYNPRPPTMIEHHNASPALAAQAAYGSQGFYPNYGEYGQESSFVPEMNQTAGSPAPQIYGAPSDYAGYNDPQQLVRQPSNMGRPAYQPPQQLARQPSNTQYLTRQPAPTTAFAPPTAPPASFDPNVRYIDLNRSSVSPYQAAQYADISRQLGTSDPNTQVPHESFDLPEGPLPSPFDDPTENAAVPSNTRLDNPAAAALPSPATTIPSPQVQGSATQPHQRPITIYGENDAYGGI